MTQHFHIAERCEHGETKRTLCDHRMEWAKWRVRQVPCEASFCPGALAKPPGYRLPDRLTVVDESLLAQATRNIDRLLNGDTELAGEVIRRVLAPLRLTEKDLPLTRVTATADGAELLEPTSLAYVYDCPWGALFADGDVEMCALDELLPGGQPGPGHTAPGEHAWRDGRGDHRPFLESDPEAFHALVWLEEAPEVRQVRRELRHESTPPMKATGR